MLRNMLLSKQGCWQPVKNAILVKQARASICASNQAFVTTACLCHTLSDSSRFKDHSSSTKTDDTRETRLTTPLRMPGETGREVLASLLRHESGRARAETRAHQADLRESHQSIFVMARDLSSMRQHRALSLWHRGVDTTSMIHVSTYPEISSGTTTAVLCPDQTTVGFQ